MKFEEAMQKIEGAQSVGGQMIAVRGAEHILVGKSVQGELIVEDTPAAKKVASEVGIAVEGSTTSQGDQFTQVQPVTHDVHVQDTVETKDAAAHQQPQPEHDPAAKPHARK
jgi:hypothetical protein